MRHKERYLRVKDGLTVATPVAQPVGSSVPIYSTWQTFVPLTEESNNHITIPITLDEPSTIMMRGFGSARANDEDAFAMIFFTDEVNLTPSNTYEELNGHPYGVFNPSNDASPLLSVTITGVDSFDAGDIDLHLGYKGARIQLINLKLVVIVGAYTGADSINYVDVVEG